MVESNILALSPSWRMHRSYKQFW